MSRSPGESKTKIYIGINKNISLSVLSLVRRLKILSNLKHKRPETPIYASTRKASYTVEAAVVLPVSFFVLIFIIYFFRVLYVGWYVDYVLSTQAREYAAVSTVKAEPNASEVISKCNKELRKNKIVVSTIQGGVKGISYANSDIRNNYVNIQASYKIKNLITFFGNKYIVMNASGCSRKWIGYDPLEDSNDGEYVYVTKYGQAYHLSLSCPYLKPSIKTTNIISVKKKRNSSGAKYKSCPLCKGKKSKGTVYITNYGEAYHSTITCSGLKRCLRRIKKTNSKGYHACGKCCK